MKKIETMTFAEWCDFAANKIIGKKILKHNDDHVFLVCGDEGKRKSTFSTATYCEVERLRGRIPKTDFLCYSWEDYKIANLFGLKNYLETLDNDRQTLALKLLKDYGIDLYSEEFTHIWEKKLSIQKGDILIFDEAGTEINARDSMSENNRDFNNLMICNRFVGLFHFLNVPKPMSLDIYPREQRARGMIWCWAEYTNDLEQRKSRMFFYTKDTYSEIFTQKRFWNLFSNQDKLIRHCPPDFEITELGDMREYIPANIQLFYDSKKWAFNMAKLLNIMRGKRKVFDEEKLVRVGESKEDWYNRTKQDPRTYSAMRLWK